MKKKIIISSAIFLSVISVAIIIFFIYISQISNGGSFTIDASKLDIVAYEEEKSIKLKDKEKKNTYVLTYYNVYRNDDNEFILKDNTSYLIFEKLDAYFSYDNYELKVTDYDELTLLESHKISDVRYSVFIAGVKKVRVSLNEDDSNLDVNIGFIETWC